MFNKILIANRGEIACRIARTARRLGVATVAVYSEADAGARHVALADEAYAIGPAPARDSYLDAGKLLDVARRSGAEAVHPGYGFLSENADFADAVAAAGLVFIGPPADAIRAMGSKSAAKSLMEQAGVALVPGYHGADQGLKTLAVAAAKIGFPLLIKASAGGGGRGMRIVDGPADLESALASARREAAAAFGDDRLLMEKYLHRPRHIEMQIFADSHGNAVHLFERDCSVQRRYQKIIEEAPAPGLDEARRAEMASAALAAARAIGYVGAGTVEFIADEDGAFYFMEMNTRLQVEHPVTEMITGIDLVEWQLRIAAGSPLPLAQDGVECRGHAFEVRLYAEDPARDFMPATGRLDHFRLPAEGPHLRVDSGVREGDEVSIHYDPMIAKLIVWDDDRRSALRRLRVALGAVEIAGVTTNTAFLAALAAHPEFIAGAVDTGFIPRHRETLFPDPQPVSDPVLALAALYVVLTRVRRANALADASEDPCSPWAQSNGWRLNGDHHDSLHFRDGATEIAVDVHYNRDGYGLDLPGGVLEARGELGANGDLVADIAGVRWNATIVARGDAMTVLTKGGAHALEFVDPLALAAGNEVAAGGLRAPMPGKVIDVRVAVGDKVTVGQALIILEAMKMEHTITAPAVGAVTALHYAPGDLVDEGAELVSVEEADDN